jgi:RNase P subunit RPR2
MVSSAEIVRRLDEERRLLCPEHHTELTYRGGQLVHCERCGFAYRYQRLTDCSRQLRGPARI